MYEPKLEIFKLPKTNRTIWRYLDLDKYYSMLEESALFLANVRKFEDVYEGHHGCYDLQKKEKFYEKMLGKDGFIFRKNESKKLTDPHVYVNCWHMNNYESAGLWNLYGDRQNGIAIKTKISSLCSSIVDARPVNVGIVQYLDTNRKEIGARYQIEHYLVKRMSFEHEKEIRCIFFDQNKVISKEKPLDENGIFVKVDLSVLVDKIYVHPNSKPYLREAVELFNKKFGLEEKIVERSTLYDLK